MVVARSLAWPTKVAGLGLRLAPGCDPVGCPGPHSWGPSWNGRNVGDMEVGGGCWLISRILSSGKPQSQWGHWAWQVTWTALSTHGPSAQPGPQGSECQAGWRWCWARPAPYRWCVRLTASPVCLVLPSLFFRYGIFK